MGLRIICTMHAIAANRVKIYKSIFHRVKITLPCQDIRVSCHEASALHQGSIRALDALHINPTTAPIFLHLFFDLTHPATARVSVLHHFGCISGRETWAPICGKASHSVRSAVVLHP